MQNAMLDDNAQNYLFSATKCNMFLDQHHCWYRNNIPINQSDLKDKFTVKKSS